MRALIALALLGGAAPASTLSTRAAEKAIAHHEGHGTKVSNCKRRHPGIVCFYRTPVPRGQNEAVRTGFDRAVLKGRRIIVSQYTEPRVIECPEDCSSPEPEARNTFAEDSARSWWEATHNQISTGPPAPNFAQLQFQADQLSKETAWVEAFKRSQIKPVVASQPSITIVVSGVVTCTQSQRLDEAEAKEAAEARFPTIERTEEQALNYAVRNGQVFETEPGPVPLLNGIPAEERAAVEEIVAPEEPVSEARLKEVQAEVAKRFLPLRESLKAQIAAIEAKAAQERAEAIAAANKREEERIAKHENGCEPHFPKLTVVPTSAMTIWQLEPNHFPPETKAVEEGKVTAFVIAEAPGMQSSQSSPVPVT